MRVAVTVGVVVAVVSAYGESTQRDPLESRSKGSPTAPVVVYEMSDFQCPYCRRHAIEAFPTLERDFIRSGKVRWIFINFPLTSIHPNAGPAAEFAMCAARQEKFWPAHDILFRYQETWAPLKNPAPFLLSLIDSLKLPKGPMVKCLDGAETRALVKSDADGARQSGAESTPTFYIEGGLMRGAQPPQLFAMILDSIYTAKTRAPKKP